MFNVIHVLIGKNYDLNWFKEKVNESFSEDQENIVYMTDYAIQPNEQMIKFWNWLSDKGCKFYWVDHHITAIQNLKNFNIPGQQYSGYSGCMNTWYLLHKNEQPPMAIQLANDFDTWNKKTKYSWDKQVLPFAHFISSLGIQINDNTGQLVETMNNLLIDNKSVENAIQIGRFIWNYVLNQYKIATRKIYELTWNDYSCLVVNSSYPGSMQFEQFEGYQNYDLMITWSFNGKTYQYGIYSTNPKINVGQIAEMYLNGGGHAGAGRRRNKRVYI